MSDKKQAKFCKCYKKFKPGETISVDSFSPLICSKCKLIIEVYSPATPLVGVDEKLKLPLIKKCRKLIQEENPNEENLSLLKPIKEFVDYIYAKFGSPQDNKFINHIQSHLSEGQEVVCKICGKTAKEICNE